MAPSRIIRVWACRAAMVAVILVGCVGCDQASKALVRTYVPVGQVYTYLGGTVRIVRAENPGAFLSIGEASSRETRDFVFKLGVGTFVIGLLLWTVFGRGLSSARRLCLATAAAAGTGNLVDRILHGGSVTDFLYLGVGPIHTGIFNVADMILCLALAGLLFERPLQSALSNFRRLE
jgi:signal peptidase II